MAGVAAPWDIDVAWAGSESGAQKKQVLDAAEAKFTALTSDPARTAEAATAGTEKQAAQDQFDTGRVTYERELGGIAPELNGKMMGDCYDKLMKSSVPGAGGSPATGKHAWNGEMIDKNAPDVESLKAVAQGYSQSYIELTFQPPEPTSPGLETELEPYLPRGPLAAEFVSISRSVSPALFTQLEDKIKEIAAPTGTGNSGNVNILIRATSTAWDYRYLSDDVIQMKSA
jgi:hypothetical protein